MSRFITSLDTALRNLIVRDTETGDELLIQQILSPSYRHQLMTTVEDTDGLVEFANNLQGDLNNGTLALELMGSSLFNFDDDSYPVLSGGVYLRHCNIRNPDLLNCRLMDVNAMETERFDISYSFIDTLTWNEEVKLHISHCYINEKYPDIRNRMSAERNEWFMGQRVEGEMW